MKRAMLLISLVLAGHWSIAMAAGPVFQLNAHAIGAERLPATHAYTSDFARDSAFTAMQGRFASHSAHSLSVAPVGFSVMEELDEAWPDARVITLNFPPNADGAHVSEKIASSVIFSDDSLFHYLKKFKAQPLRKPDLWTMFLIGLCFVLYQVRRRPMRKAIGFYPVAGAPVNMVLDATPGDRSPLRGTWKRYLGKVIFGLESDFELL